MKKIYKLEDLDCAHCAAKMEDGIRKLDGVTAASISFLAQKLTLEVADGADLKKIEAAVVAVCKKIEPDCTVYL